MNHLTEEYRHTADKLFDTGIDLADAKRYPEALAAFRRALDLYRQTGDSHEDLADCLTNIGVTLRRVGQHEEALTSYRQALDIYRRIDDT